MNGAQQRGVALIAALLVVALAVVLVAALLDTGEATRARSRNALRAEQTWQLMHGLELWAQRALLRDLDNGAGLDSAEEAWAQPLPPLQIPGGRVFGRLRERSGCFNLNRLAARGDGGGAHDPLARFERLLRALRLDPAIAAQALDWVDADVEPSPGGAEDLRYLQQRPAYRSANRRFEHVSELRLLAGVDAETYARLAPHVCALPEDARTNLNFASVALWMSLHDGISESLAHTLARDGRARYVDLDAVRSEILRTVPQLPPLSADEYSVYSDYFVVEADIVIDEIPYAFASLLKREPAAVHVLQRARGRL